MPLTAKVANHRGDGAIGRSDLLTPKINLFHQAGDRVNSGRGAGAGTWSAAAEVPLQGGGSHWPDVPPPATRNPAIPPEGAWSRKRQG